jgi:hypothetical protein
MEESAVHLKYSGQGFAHDAIALWTLAKPIAVLPDLKSSSACAIAPVPIYSQNQPTRAIRNAGVHGEEVILKE